MPYIKMSLLTEDNVRKICSNCYSCRSCPLWNKNLTSCLSDSKGKFIVKSKDVKVFVPVKDGKFVFGQGRLF